MRILMTNFIKKSELKNDWYIIDANNAVVGRLASIIAKIIRGKHKTTFTPHMDHGDFVVVKNIENIKFTGKKFENKKYYRHTGYPGGIKETTPKSLHNKKPGEVLKLAVKRMLPGGPLAKKQLTKLKMYTGDKHPHEAQYVVNFAYRYPYFMKMNLREACHLIELRTAPQGHPDYRKVAQEMYHAIESVHPNLAKAIKFVDLKDYVLERFNAEKKSEMKRQNVGVN